MTINNILAASLLSLIAIPTFANANTNAADKTGWFVGGQIGYSNIQIDKNTDTAYDDNTESYGVYGGYNFTPWFGLEGNIEQNSKINDLTNQQSGELVSLSFSPKFTHQVLLSDATRRLMILKFADYLTAHFILFLLFLFLLFIASLYFWAYMLCE